MKRAKVIGAGIALGVLLMALSCGEEKKEKDYHTTLPSSLHGTTRGMEYWYMDGMFHITNIQYADLNCKSCHAEGCATCHDVDDKGEPVITATSKEKDPNTCFGCHGRHKTLNKIMANMGTSDVHAQKGMKCGDCHTGREIHGDGKTWDTLLEAGFFDTKCENCHKIDSLPKNTEHSMHAGKTIDCQACHVKTVVSCYNCHFNAEILHEKKVAYGPMANFVLLVKNKEGKITSGTIMSMDYVTDLNNVDASTKTLLAVAPYYAHSITSAGRTCSDCHKNPAVQEYNEKGKITLTYWDEESGKIKNKTGVIPYAKNGALEVIFARPKDPSAAPLCSEQGCMYPEWITIGTKIDLEHSVGEPLGDEVMEKLSK